MVDALTLRKAESAKYPLLEVNLITESGEERDTWPLMNLRLSEFHIL